MILLCHKSWLTLFCYTSIWNSRVKCDWTGVVEGWMTYRKVIRDIVWVRPKCGERSCDDYKISKQWFRALKNLCTDRWNRIRPTGGVSGCGWSIRCGRSERYKWHQSRVSYCVSETKVRRKVIWWLQASKQWIWTLKNLCTDRWTRWDHIPSEQGWAVHWSWTVGAL